MFLSLPHVMIVMNMSAMMEASSHKVMSQQASANILESRSLDFQSGKALLLVNGKHFWSAVGMLNVQIIEDDKKVNMHTLIKSLEMAVTDLEEKIRLNNYAGYDPYDAKGASFFMRALAIPRKPWHANVRRKLTLAPLIYGERFFPLSFRHLARIKPQVNAKGMGLIAKAYFNLYAANRDEHWYDLGQACLDWFLQNRCQDHPYPCWGYPFNWDSGVVVPAHTPTSVVTSAAFDAFWEAWVQTKRAEYLETCKKICEFFLHGLNITKHSNGTVSFSYTHLDHFEVHNINLMVAHCLLRAGKEINNASYCDYGLRAARFTMNEQNEDGSIYYWSKAQNFHNPNSIDHYHSGFEIRALFGIWQVTNDAEVLKAYQKYYEFYRGRLCERSNGCIIPKMNLKSVYPINIHSCAEAVLLAATLCRGDNRALNDLFKVVPWTLSKMRMKSGFYRYLIHKFGFLEIRSNIVYMRWSQAWIFLALSEAYRAIKEIETI